LFFLCATSQEARYDLAHRQWRRRDPIGQQMARIEWIAKPRPSDVAGHFRRACVMRHLYVVVVAIVAAQLSLLAAPPASKPVVGDVYVLNAALGTNQVLCDQTVCATTLGSITVPAGAYVITAKVVVSSWESTGEGRTFCYLYAGATILDTIAASTPAAQHYFVPASLQAVSSFSSSQSVQLKCTNDNNGNIPAVVQTSAQNWKLTATRVGTVTTQ
jgi:hypothetical protein